MIRRAFWWVIVTRQWRPAPWIVRGLAWRLARCGHSAGGASWRCWDSLSVMSGVACTQPGAGVAGGIRFSGGAPGLAQELVAMGPTTSGNRCLPAGNAGIFPGVVTPTRELHSVQSGGFVDGGVRAQIAGAVRDDGVHFSGCMLPGNGISARGNLVIRCIRYHAVLDYRWRGAVFSTAAGVGASMRDRWRGTGDSPNRGAVVPGLIPVCRVNDEPCTDRRIDDGSPSQIGRHPRRRPAGSPA